MNKLDEDYDGLQLSFFINLTVYLPIFKTKFFVNRMI